jgi:L-lactate utilization protein LutC
MTNREEFLGSVRRALKSGSGAAPQDTGGARALSPDLESADERARLARQQAEANAYELMSQLQETAAEAGWEVTRVASAQQAARYIGDLARKLEARSVLRSGHPVLDLIDLEAALSGTGIEVGLMAIEEGADERRSDAMRRSLRARAIEADIGLTGVDYAIAETGTCVLLPRKGVSRLVSLLPPVHVAVVRRGEVLPSLDELFTLESEAFLRGSLGSYMNLIAGPSRSADIEYTLVTGVHGPGEVHMVLLG